jgi:uncharacterized protein YciI
MDHLMYGRAAAGAGDEDVPELDEAHWSYMDTFAGRMTARGPTLSPDRETWTGSLHVVDLADGAAARAFALDEPYHRARLFRDHLIRRFDNLLGRTMWDVTPEPGDVPFLILADGPAPSPTGREPQPPLAPDVRARLVLWGTLHPADDEPAPTRGGSGLALGLLAPDAAAARAVIAAEPTLLGGRTAWELHAWEFGGRR